MITDNVTSIQSSVSSCIMTSNTIAYTDTSGITSTNVDTGNMNTSKYIDHVAKRDTVYIDLRDRHRHHRHRGRRYYH